MPMPKMGGHAASNYNNPGTIQQNVPTDSTASQLVEHWVDFWFEWFRVIGRTGRDSRKFEQLHPTVSHLVYCRFNEKTSIVVPTRFRIKLDGGKILNIRSVFDPQTRRVEMEYQCTEVML